MTVVAERIARLRALMAEKHIDAYVVPTADFHQSEYVGEHFKARKYITGFSGSYGTAVITMDDGGLWTDGRYFIQAEAQLKGSGITLYKSGESDVPTIEEFLKSELKEGDVLGFDGRTVTYAQGKRYCHIADENGASLKYRLDFAQNIWKERPEMSLKPVFSLEDKYTGEKTGSKFKRIREKMKENGCNAHILSSLDDIAWLLNIRGNDIAYCPLVLS